MIDWARWKVRSGGALGNNPWQNALGDLRKRKGNAPKRLPAYQEPTAYGDFKEREDASGFDLWGLGRQWAAWRPVGF